MYQKKFNLSRTQKKALSPKKITFNKSQNSKLKKDKQEPIKLENKFKINKIQKENKSKLYTLNSNIKNKSQEKILTKNKDIKKEERKDLKLNKNNNNNNNNNTIDNNSIQIKNEKRKIFNLKLSKNEINKLINESKARNIQSNKSSDDIFINSLNLDKQKTLKILSNKQKSLYNEMEKIKEQKNLLGEYSLNNLDMKNLLYKNIQSDNTKKLVENENNVLEKISCLNQQMNILNNQNKNNNIVNVLNNNLIKEDYLDKIKKEKNSKDIVKKIRKLQIQNNLNEEKRKKEIELNQEKRNKEIDLINKENLDKKNMELLEKKLEEKKIVDQRKKEINSIMKKFNPFINNGKIDRNGKKYLYKIMATSFEKKEENYINKVLKNKTVEENNEKNDFDRYDFLLKKKLESVEKMQNLHQIWKERSKLLPKYISPMYQKVLYSEENLKEDEENKIENKKRLFEMKQKYVKEKIPLPRINYSLKLSHDKKDIKPKLYGNKTQKHNNKIINLKLMKINKINMDNISKNDIILKKTNNLSISKDKKVTKSFSGILNNNKSYIESSNYKLGNKKFIDELIKEKRKERLIQFKKEPKKIIINNNDNNGLNIEAVKGQIEVMEDKYRRGKELLKVKGGYINNKEFGDKMDQLLIDSIKNKLDIIENMNS